MENRKTPITIRSWLTQGHFVLAKAWAWLSKSADRKSSTGFNNFGGLKHKENICLFRSAWGRTQRDWETSLREALSIQIQVKASLCVLVCLLDLKHVDILVCNQ